MAAQPDLAPLVGETKAALVWMLDPLRIVWASPQTYDLTRALILDKSGRIAPYFPGAARIEALLRGIAPREGQRLEKVRFETSALAPLATCACRLVRMPNGQDALITGFVERVPNVRKPKLPRTEAPATSKRAAPDHRSTDDRVVQAADAAVTSAAPASAADSQPPCNRIRAASGNAGARPRPRYLPCTLPLGSRWRGADHACLRGNWPGPSAKATPRSSASASRICSAPVKTRAPSIRRTCSARSWRGAKPSAGGVSTGAPDKVMMRSPSIWPVCRPQRRTAPPIVASVSAAPASASPGRSCGRKRYPPLRVRSHRHPRRIWQAPIPAFAQTPLARIATVSPYALDRPSLTPRMSEAAAGRCGASHAFRRIARSRHRTDPDRGHARRSGAAALQAGRDRSLTARTRAGYGREAGRRTHGRG